MLSVSQNSSCQWRAIIKFDLGPAKMLGPILRRSLMDIRSDIAELHSRSSRTNCEFICRF
jgi:hypothetical protein